eukprot:jgi/Hompol1/5033/HPOL_000568-RA
MPLLNVLDSDTEVYADKMDGLLSECLLSTVRKLFVATRIDVLDHPGRLKKVSYILSKLPISFIVFSLRFVNPSTADQYKRYAARIDNDRMVAIEALVQSSELSSLDRECDLIKTFESGGIKSLSSDELKFALNLIHQVTLF